MRVLPNGDIIIPMRGRPPKSVPGYYQDDNDPWLWHPDVDPCKFRKEDIKRVPCRNDPRGYKEQKILRCLHFGCEITLARCQTCLESQPE